MMAGRYGKGRGQHRQVLPRVVHISIARYRAELPRPGDPLEFLVSIHEEGTGMTWQQNITVDPATERLLLDTTQALYAWSLDDGRGRDASPAQVRGLGTRLYDTFITPAGHQVLAGVVPTAVLLDVDETILNLPWELAATPEGPIAQRTPFGRLVTTRTVPKPSRDPEQEDNVLRILVVANPTGDLAAAELEIGTIAMLEGEHGDFSIQVDELTGRDATTARFLERLRGADYDILHFAGHAFLDPTQPETGALRFADAELAASDVLALPWRSPPYLVFNSACESGRAAGGRRLITGESQANGLAAAFLAAGAQAYAGYFWPVSDVGANLFAGTFYRKLVQWENVGIAFLEARTAAVRELEGEGDLTGYSAVLFGDAASSHRRDLATAA
jgi:hypothetical protein